MYIKPLIYVYISKNFSLLFIGLYVKLNMRSQISLSDANIGSHGLFKPPPCLLMTYGSISEKPDSHHPPFICALFISSIHVD